MVHVLELPSCFYDDHSGRMSDKDPAIPAFSDQLIKRKSKTVVVQACDEALDEIENDADYYASLRAGIDVERDMFGVIMSAKATLRRIRKYREAQQNRAETNESRA